MRQLIFILTLFVFTLQANAGDIRKGKVEDAVKRAITFIDKALEKNSPMQEVLLLMRNAYEDVQWKPRSQNWQHCIDKPTVRAFVTRGTRTIHLCSSLFEEQMWDTNSLAQILLHESAHVIGFSDECVASRFEVGTLKLAKKSAFFESDYWKSCGITKKLDPFQIVVTPIP